MLNYRCLVLDHDDTVVRSAETVNYPAMLDALKLMRPGMTISYRDFMVKCFEQDFFAMCREMFDFTKEEIDYEFELWKAYVRSHIPPAYEGMLPLLSRFREEGGIICVSSHSGVENITRDYKLHFGFVPDQIFGWELLEKRKPHPFALEEIIRIYELRPDELLMVDDMKTGLHMAQSCKVPFACAGWSHADPAISSVMRRECETYLDSVADLEKFIFRQDTP